MSAKNRYIPDYIMRLKGVNFEAIYREKMVRKNKKINSKNKRGTCTILKKFNKTLDIPMNNNLLDVITNYLE